MRILYILFRVFLFLCFAHCNNCAVLFVFGIGNMGRKNACGFVYIGRCLLVKSIRLFVWGRSIWTEMRIRTEFNMFYFKNQRGDNFNCLHPQSIEQNLNRICQQLVVSQVNSIQ